jgi:hypothetical protein
MNFGKTINFLRRKFDEFKCQSNKEKLSDLKKILIAQNVDYGLQL